VLGSFAKWRDKGFPPYPIDPADVFSPYQSRKTNIRLRGSELALTFSWNNYNTLEKKLSKEIYRNLIYHIVWYTIICIIPGRGRSVPGQKLLDEPASEAPQYLKLPI